jgi:hypothetical protein
MKHYAISARFLIIFQVKHLVQDGVQIQIFVILSKFKEMVL